MRSTLRHATQPQNAVGSKFLMGLLLFNAISSVGGGIGLGADRHHRGCHLDGALAFLARATPGSTVAPSRPSFMTSYNVSHSISGSTPGVVAGQSILPPPARVSHSRWIGA
jgi:hypothetical protein